MSHVDAGERGDFNGVSINRPLRKARVDLMNDLSINKKQSKQTRFVAAAVRPTPSRNGASIRNRSHRIIRKAKLENDAILHLPVFISELQLNVR